MRKKLDRRLVVTHTHTYAYKNTQRKKERKKGAIYLSIYLCLEKKKTLNRGSEKYIVGNLFEVFKQDN